MVILGIVITNFLHLTSRIQNIQACERELRAAARQRMLIHRSGTIFLQLLKSTYPVDRARLHRQLIATNLESMGNARLLRMPPELDKYTQAYHGHVETFASVPTERLPFFISNPTVAAIYRMIDEGELINGYTDWIEEQGSRHEAFVRGFYHERLYALLVQLTMLVALVISLRHLDVQKQREIFLMRMKETMEVKIRENEAILERVQKDMDNARHLADIGTLTAVVAHELRNPLAAIALATVNLKHKIKNGGLERSLRTIETNIFESDQIINNLLFYTRLKHPVFETIAVNDIIVDCVNLLIQRGGSKKFHIETKLTDTAELSIDADVVQLKEVFNNILNNSCDALKETGGEIEIRTGILEAEIEIIISDNGCGIEKEKLSKITEPFFTTKRRGTGLGLSICQQIVTLHGGTLYIDSAVNEGTTVRVVLPRQRSEKV